MNLRVKQKELSLEMLRALQENKLALCEAEVGTGKTHAYILALTVHNIYSNRKAPAVISTSTIALHDIVNIGLHFILKNVRPYAASCSEA